MSDPLTIKEFQLLNEDIANALVQYPELHIDKIVMRSYMDNPQAELYIPFPEWICLQCPFVSCSKYGSTIYARKSAAAEWPHSVCFVASLTVPDDITKGLRAEDIERLWHEGLLIG